MPKAMKDSFQIERVQSAQGMVMSRGEYNKYRGWSLPEDENGDDDGVMLVNGDHISWIPKGVFNAECIIKNEDIDYSAMVHSLKKSGDDILQSLTPEKCSLIHMGMGISGEAGELLDAIKKFTIYEKNIDRENVVEEMGDIEFFLEGIRQDLNISKEEILNHNITKLGKRYPAGLFTNADAQARADKKTEYDPDDYSEPMDLKAK